MRRKTPFIDPRDGKIKRLIRFTYSKRLDTNEPMDKVHKLLLFSADSIVEEMEEHFKIDKERPHAYMYVKFENFKQFFHQQTEEEEAQGKEELKEAEKDASLLDFALECSRHRILALKRTHGASLPNGGVFEYLVEDQCSSTIYVGCVYQKEI